MIVKEEIIQRIIDPGLVAVVRVGSRSEVLPVCRALVAGGIRALEVTLTVPEALKAIREVRGAFGAEVAVGVGTVLNGDQCQAAMEAGAEFVVSPIMRPELVEIAHAGGCPTMLGAFTPTEAQAAFEAGSDFIKLFPAEVLGPSFIKSLLAPLPHLRVVPTGGVNLETLGAFLKAGCAALGVGSSLLDKKMIREERWEELTGLAKRYVDSVCEAR